MAAIHKSIIEIMKSLDSLPKDKTNPEGWSFRSVETLIKRLQPLFIGQGIVCTCEVKSVIREQPTKDVRSRTVLTLRYTLTSAIDESSISTECVGEGECLNDKATPKAMTGTLKQLFFQLFMIPVSDDTDPDAHSVGSKQASAPRGAPAKPTEVPQKQPSQPAKVPDPQKPKPADNTISDEVKRKLETIRRGIVKISGLYTDHDDGYKEVTVDAAGNSSENSKSLIVRVDDIRAAIEAIQACSERGLVLNEFETLIGKTNRAEEVRKSLVTQISVMSSDSPKEKKQELIVAIAEATSSMKITRATQRQLLESLKQLAGE